MNCIGKTIKALKGIMKGVHMRTSDAFNVIDYIIPITEITAVSTTNQPANDGVEVVSSSASDTQQITLWGNPNGSTDIVYETITLTGTTAVSTIKTDWGTIYGAFLGDQYGLISSRAVGTITIREASGDLAITTIAVGKLGTGQQRFALAGRKVGIENILGVTYFNTGNALATTTSASAQMEARMTISTTVDSFLTLVSDGTGSTLQVYVFK